jgi:hypothetical protein
MVYLVGRLLAFLYAHSLNPSKYLFQKVFVVISVCEAIRSCIVVIIIQSRDWHLFLTMAGKDAEKQNKS